jgi:futalosine hydrolase
MTAMHTLLLVPTQFERRAIETVVAPALGRDDRLELCGFGPVAAAARTAELLALHRPERVVLAGIAGSLDDGLAPGVACSFTRVACFGVGVGARDDFLPAGVLGWPQWQGDPHDGSPPIGDVIECAAGAPGPGDRLLLTACAASARQDDVRARLRCFPDAVAEDMEGFAVAFACRLRGVPVAIVRGISNRAGDRDQSRWHSAAALQAAGELARHVIAEAP